jgi:hypothetical protein
MAHKVQASATYGPRIVTSTPMEADEFVEQLVVSTNQSRGSLLAMLAEMESISEIALKSGRIVKLPNGMTLRPTMKRTGHIEIVVKVNKAFTRHVNTGFRGKVINPENIGKSEAELIELWNKDHPEDRISS